MFQIAKDASFAGTDIPFGVLEVCYPPQGEWDEKAFHARKDQELEEIMGGAEQYVRKEVFGENPYFRYFRKFKKTYPVMMQFESLLQKTRPFPNSNLINQVAFLAELKTHMLLGTHDVDRVEGTLVLFRGTEKTSFCGMGERDVHIYPNDISGRDDQGIVLSMLAGADNRTYISADSRRVAYFVFGVDGMEKSKVDATMDLLEEYVKTLAPGASMERAII